MPYASHQERLKAILGELKRSSKSRLFCVATTANRSNPEIHFGGIRETSSTIAGNAILRSSAPLQWLIPEIDGQVETILVDCEVKTDHADFAKVAASLIRKSRIHYFKPNDIAVDSLDHLVSSALGSLDGVIVAVVGAGNLGSKIALKLTERGAQVRLVGRDPVKLTRIVEGLSHIQRGSGAIEAATDVVAACEDAKLLIGATNGSPSISSRAIQSLGEDAWVIDAGNGTLASGAIEACHKRELQLRCLIPTAGYEAMIAALMLTRESLLKTGARKFGNARVITPGLLGAAGDVLVDRLDPPFRVIGVCDGKGDILAPEEATPFLENLAREVKTFEGTK